MVSANVMVAQSTKNLAEKKKRQAVVEEEFFEAQKRAKGAESKAYLVPVSLKAIWHKTFPTFCP